MADVIYLLLIAVLFGITHLLVLAFARLKGGA